MSEADAELYLANRNFNWQPLSPQELKETVRDLKCQWSIAGGWAIDLFLGKQTRNHEDIDLIVKREDQFEVQNVLEDWELWVADPPGSLRPWKKSEYIGKGLQDVWCRRTKHDPWAIQVMLYDVENNYWIFKREESIRKNLQDALIQSRDGFSILAPEVQLLYKSKALRAKDRADFESALPALNSEQKSWLKETLRKVYQGRHEWIGRL